MFGLEQNQKEPFSYDIEKEIRKDAKKAKEILQRLSESEHEIAQLLKTECKDENLEVLLKGYQTLPKVIQRIQKPKQ